VTLAGDLLVLGACAGSAFGYVAGARLAQRVGSWAATFWAINLASLVQAPFILWRWSDADWGHLGPAAWAALLHLTYGVTILALFAWFWALARGGIARVAALQFAQPVIALGLAAALLGERLTLPLALAAAAILAGIAIARR
jgi:drug/metabolite transporter (DMT)-like permease